MIYGIYTVMKDNNEQETVKYKYLLSEAKNRYSETSKSFAEMRNRMFVLFSAELAIMTYLFSDLLNLIPSELYGQVIFYTACLGILVAVGILFIYFRSIFNWPGPIGDADRARIIGMNNELDVIKYIEEDYRNANDKAQSILKKRGKALNISMQIFVISAIILLIMKIF